MATAKSRFLPAHQPRHKRASSVFGDEVMAAALIDRLLHHCHIVNIRGNSYRMREHRNLMRSASDQPRQGESDDWAS